MQEGDSRHKDALCSVEKYGATIQNLRSQVAWFPKKKKEKEKPKPNAFVPCLSLQKQLTLFTSCTFWGLNSSASPSLIHVLSAA